MANESVRLEGVDELKRAMAAVAKNIRTKAVRSALRKAGAVISNEAKRNAPRLQVATATRKPGTVRKAIGVRASKAARRAGDEGVFIGVRPLRGARQRKLGQAGARNPNDPYYWRFVEFGTRKMRARPFLRPAANSKGTEAIQTFMREVVPAIEKENQRVR